MTQINSSQIKDQAITASKISPLAVAWTAPTLQNNWVNYNASLYTPASYSKDSIGMVHLRGLIKNGVTTIDTTIFTLPAGCRPIKAMHIPVASNGAFGNIKIEVNGEVKFQVGSSSWFSLDGITFYAEN